MPIVLIRSLILILVSSGISLAEQDKIHSAAADTQLPAPTQAHARALAHYHLALRAERQGDARQALLQLQATLAHSPGPPSLVQSAANLALRLESHATAKKILTDAAALQPESAEMQLAVIDFLDANPINTEIRRETDQKMEQIRQRFPSDLSVLEKAIQRKLISSERSAAEQYFDDFLNHPQNRQLPAEACLTLASQAERIWPIGLPEHREEHLERINTLYLRALNAARLTSDEASQLKVAQYYLLTNQLELARSLCENLANHNGNLTARKVLFRLYESFDLPEKALAVLEQLVRDEPHDLTQRRLLVEAMEKRQRTAEAARHLQAILQFGGGQAADYDKLTDLWLSLRQPENALSIAQRATKLFPQSASFHAKLGLAQSATDDLNAAVQSLATADDLARNSLDYSFNHHFYFRYGTILERSGRHEQAAIQFRRAIDLTPSDEPDTLANTLNYLGYMWLEQNQNLEEAGDLILKANELERDNPAFIDSLGWYYHKLGEHETALPLLQKAINLLGDLRGEDIEILEHIATVQEALAQPDAALDTLRQALQLKNSDEEIRQRVRQSIKRLTQLKSPLKSPPQKAPPSAPAQP